MKKLTVYLLLITVAGLCDDRPVTPEDAATQLGAGRVRNEQAVQRLATVRSVLADAASGKDDIGSRAAVVEVDIRLCLENFDFNTAEYKLNGRLAAMTRDLANEWAGKASGSAASKRTAAEAEFSNQLQNIEFAIDELLRKPSTADTIAQLAALESRKQRLVATLERLRQRNSAPFDYYAAAAQDMRDKQAYFEKAAEFAKDEAAATARMCAAMFDDLKDLAAPQSDESIRTRWAKAFPGVRGPALSVPAPVAIAVAAPNADGTAVEDLKNRVGRIESILSDPVALEKRVIDMKQVIEAPSPSTGATK